jgi:hypothetical protein
MKGQTPTTSLAFMGLDNSVVDYVISNILVFDHIVNFDLLNKHETKSDHRPLTLTLNFSMHKSPIEENFDNERHLLFDKSKYNLFLKDLNSNLHVLTYKENIEDFYHKFTTTLSTSINKLYIEVSCRRNNRKNKPWYDKECKISRKSIRDASNESLNINKINTYKSLIKREKKYYINRKQERLLHLSKLDPKKFLRKIIIHKTKENNIILWKDLNSYLKNIYETPNAMDTIPNIPTEDEYFSLEYIELRVKQLSNGKAKDIESYQAKIFKIRGPILIPHIHKFFNLTVKKTSLKPRCKA